MSRILIIEDRDSLRDMLVTFLKDHDVLAAESAEAAEPLLVHMPEIVLCDYRLPGKTGIAFIQEHQAALSESIIIIMTAFGDIPTAVAAMRAGAHDFLPKPLDLSHLSLVIERAEEMLRLRRLQPESRPVRIVAQSETMKSVLSTAGKFANTDHAILLSGESGTGKEILARWIHQHSNRAQEPFQALNCAAIPENLLESELYGHVQGAFTGATRKRTGLLERAGNGTLFLDEIGATGKAFQAKILRFVETGEFYPLGDDRIRFSTARLILATNRNLSQLIREGQFREDLYHRIGTFQIQIPPLRNRKQDIAPLAIQFADSLGTQINGAPFKLTPAILKQLEDAGWPGNVRELQNTIERWAILGPQLDQNGTDTGDAGQITVHLENRTRDEVLEEVESRLIRHALAHCNGNKLAASRELGMNYKTLLSRIKMLGIRES